MSIFIDVDPNAPHAEECNFWHGGTCDCTPEMRAARDRDHCHECDFVNSYTGSARCNCEGFCICERIEEEGCSCIGRIPVKLPEQSCPAAHDSEEDSR